MEMQHWVMLIVVAAAFYLIGAKYPMTAQRFGF
jgi:hypothetical protein